MRKLITFSAIGIAVFAGCTMTPNYKRPESPESDKWPSAEMGKGATVSDVGWQDFYKDEKLQKVISLALENNRDMRVAALNVEKLRAQYRMQRANLLPEVSATGAETKTRTPGDLTSSGSPVTSDQYSVKAGVTSWEVDLFGRVRSLNAQALETYLASEATRESVRISLIAEVVDQYLARISFAEDLRIARDNLAAVEKSRDLTLEIRKIGRNSDLDVQSALAEVESARASVASYERQLAAADNALALVVGCALPEELLSDAPLLENITLAGDLSAGLPSGLLTRRPDIMAAEHTLKAANANIGAARAAFFPKIALTGSYGTASADLNGLFKSGSEAWTFAPTISVPIFSGGANKASLDAAKIEKRIEIASYEKAIQTAFREVSDVLVSAEPLKREMEADRAQVAAQQRRLDLATERYKAGLDSYLVVLTAQQAYFSAQKSLVAARLALIENRVTFYKVLGGGWEAEK
jgi:outer membrane protein, multidrug efflux system